MKNTGLIYIEGNIASGKTTLLDLLSEKLEIKKIYERIPDENSLKRFYDNEIVNNLLIELSFVESRFTQLSEEIDFDQLNICDYSFYRSLIIGKVNLTEDEFLIFQKIVRIISGSLPCPDLMIFIDTTHEKLKSNLSKRDRNAEASITIEYIEKVNQSYNQFVSKYKGSKIIILKTNGLDFANNLQIREYIVNKIEEALNNDFEKLEIKLEDMSKSN
jgi:deoxyguanosine kinase